MEVASQIGLTAQKIMHRNNGNRVNQFKNYEQMAFLIILETTYGSHVWSVPSQFLIFWSPAPRLLSIGPQGKILAIKLNVRGRMLSTFNYAGNCLKSERVYNWLLNVQQGAQLFQLKIVKCHSTIQQTPAKPGAALQTPLLLIH